MTLEATLADRYAIERELGQGGMATVYLAEDLKHERRVAIKVLKPELAAVIGGERFVSEIKTTAALQHPHILPLFDSGEADGFLYYVMPFIDGETLRDRLDAERQLPVEESVKLIRQCADALDYAHRRGVIHRDIKPANILLHEGNPVVADFGIALAISAAGGGRLTETGLSLGTPHYMSPEQAAADRDLTSRSDVYSLGAVLYEMLAGDPPHTGPSAQAILMRILTEDPRPITDSRRSVPANVAAAIAKSLEKLPADRFESAAAFSEALGDRGFAYTAPQRATSAPAHATPGVSAGDRSRGFRWTDPRSLAAMALLLVVGAALGFSLRPTEAVDPRPVVNVPFHNPRPIQPAISRDGSMVAYADRDGYWLQRLDEREPVRLLDYESPGPPVFSPDGEWIAFEHMGDIKRISTRGGSPTTIADLSGGGLIISDWGDGGEILYTTIDGTYAVDWTGENEPRRILEASLFAGRGARFIPGANAIIYTEHTIASARGRIRLLNIDTGMDSVLIEDGLDPRYVSSGHILFARMDQSLFAIPFDRRTLEPTGVEVPVLDSLGVSFSMGVATLDVSETGTAIYGLTAPIDGWRGRDRRERRELVFVDRGVPIATGVPAAIGLSEPEVSPDGRFITYRDQANSNIFDTVVGNNRPLTPAPTPITATTWRPDGESIDALGIADGVGIYNVRPGSGAAPALVWRPPSDSTRVVNPLGWTRDGTRLILVAFSDDGDRDLFTLTFGPDTVAVPYLDADWNEDSAALSPDDRWIAYDSDQDGQPAVYVRSFPVPGPAIRVSPGPGSNPVWDPAGDRIYYRFRDSVMVAEVTPEDGAFSVGEVRSLFGGYPPGAFDIMPDGRFVMVRDVEEPGAGDAAEPGPAETEDPGPQTFIVVNWFEKLRARFEDGGD